MTKVNAKKGTETKSNIFLWEIFKSDIIFSRSKKIKVFQWFLKLVSLNFMTTKSANKENGPNQTIFHKT